MAQDVVRGDARLACFVGIVVFFVCVGGVNRMYGNGLLLGLFFLICVCVGGGLGTVGFMSSLVLLLFFRFGPSAPPRPIQPKQSKHTTTHRRSRACPTRPGAPRGGRRVRICRSPRGTCPPARGCRASGAARPPVVAWEGWGRCWGSGATRSGARPTRERGARVPPGIDIYMQTKQAVLVVCADLVNDPAHRLGAREEDEVPPLGQQRCGLGGGWGE